MYYLGTKMIETKIEIRSGFVKVAYILKSEYGLFFILLYYLCRLDCLDCVWIPECSCSLLTHFVTAFNCVL